MSNTHLQQAGWIVAGLLLVVLVFQAARINGGSIAKGVVTLVAAFLALVILTGGLIFFGPCVIAVFVGSEEGRWCLGLGYGWGVAAALAVYNIIAFCGMGGLNDA